MRRGETPRIPRPVSTLCLRKTRRCGRHALAKIRLCSRKSRGSDGVTNGERQIEIASRGAGVIEGARASQASYSSAHFACASIGKGPPAIALPEAHL